MDIKRADLPIQLSFYCISCNRRGRFIYKGNGICDDCFIKIKKEEVDEKKKA